MESRELHGAGSFIDAVTDFLFVEDKPETADIILIPGSNDPVNAEHAAALYHQGYAKLLLPSGRFSKPVGHFAGVCEGARQRYPDDYETECAFLTDVLMKHGVPASAILREDQATYTWENAQLSRRLTDSIGLRVKTAIISCKPWHARRSRMYYAAAFPEARLLVCPASVPGFSREDWYETCEGRTMILGEVTRCGNQVKEVLGWQVTGDTEAMQHE